MMTIAMLTKQFNGLIGKCAHRYHTGIWSPEDVKQEITLDLIEAIQAKEITELTPQKRIKSQIITKAIDLVRTENVRQGRKNRDRDDLEFDVIKDQGPRTSTRSEADYNADVQEWYDFLEAEIGPEKARLVSELAFPSPQTALLTQERIESHTGATQNLRKDTSQKDVCTSLNVSKAMVSRALKLARETIDKDSLRS